MYVRVCMCVLTCFFALDELGHSPPTTVLFRHGTLLGYQVAREGEKKGSAGQWYVWDDSSNGDCTTC